MSRTRRSGNFSENYLYFANGGQNDTDKDAVMYAESRCLGMKSQETNQLEVFFEPRDGTHSIGDGVNFTHTAGNQKAVMEEFCSLASSSRANTNNFVVIVDLNTNLPSNEGAISSAGISDISAITVTTH
jgi:hypothetical protein